MKSLVKVIFIFMFLLEISACAGPGKPNLPPEDAVSSNIAVETYTIDVGDNLTIKVWKNPELSISEPVRPDGKISMPLVGDVLAAGREPEELAASIEEALSNYVKNPNVTVILTGLQGHEFLSSIRITGAVGNNMAITYHQGMTVIDAVLAAGSINTYADGNYTKLYRRSNGVTATYDIRLDDILENGDMTTNVLLMPGDVITVPERTF
jgi:polysaccharide export outer membrane protein